MKVTRSLPTESQIHSLIGAVYEAATWPQGWATVVESFCEVARGDAAVLQVYDSERTHGNAMWWTGAPDEAVAEYPQWISRNPHLQVTMPSLQSGFIMRNTPVPRDEYLRSEYYNEYMRRYLPLYASSGCCIHADGPSSVTLAVDRIHARDEFDGHHEKLLRLLLPHLQRAMVIHQRMAGIEHQHMANVAAFDALDFGMILLSDRGTVVTTNETARGMLAAADALTLTASGHVRAIASRERSKLDALIASACSASRIVSMRAGGGAVRVPRRNGMPPLEVVVSPLRLREIMLTQAPPAAVVFIRIPEKTATTIARLQQLYDLTPAEARVAQQLVAGRSVGELSELLRLSVPTARTHVRRLLVKTGAKSISDLTLRLGGLLPVR